MRLDPAVVRAQMEERSDEELADILRTRDDGEWQDAVYDIVEEILRDRGHALTALDAPPIARAVAFVATSLDGFIAREDGSLDWLDAANAELPEGADSGFAEFLAGVDTLVMGRASFDTVRGFDEWPYDGLRVIVLTHRPLDLPEDFPAEVESSSEEPIALLTRLAAEGATCVYVDGGRTVQAFLAADAIDEITITTIPVLLGAGRPLFGALPGDVPLLHKDTRVYPWGYVQSTFVVQRLLKDEPAGD